MHDLAMRWRLQALVIAALLAMLVVGGALLFGMDKPAQAAPKVCKTNFCIDKTAAPDTVEVGEQITFTITQRCPKSSGCFTAVDLVDQLPSGLTVASVDDSQPDYQCSTSGTTVTCPGGAETRQLTPDQPFTLTIVANTAECGTFINTASSGSNSGQVTFRVSCVPATKEECQNGGFRDLGYANKGACLRAVP
jgi:fimbrial isopeptide formation D2 family protein